MKRRNTHPAQRMIASSLVVSMLGLATFGTQAIAQQVPAYPPPSAPAAPAAYTPPTADQLYQMVAPIALFPDKLVALVLAGSTYPDQITAANDLVTQNPNLTGAALVSTANQQPWDPSVKGLTEFPAVLSQMSSNMAWTTALGQAYYNDPTDVLNAVQVMRRRAQAAGHLSTNSQMVVTTAPPVVTPQYVPAPDAPLIYDGPAIIPPPPETIVIEPAQPNIVYVPSYNPAVVYGAPVAYYPGYVYEPPVFAPGIGVTVGLISFGVGIAVGAAIFSHVDWGWHNWGMHWAPPPSFGPSGPGGGWRPSVVYNHTTYISRTNTTIINRYNNNRVVNNFGNHRPTPQQMRAQQMNEQRLHTQQMRMLQHPAMHPAMHPGAPAAEHRGGAAPHPGAMTMPHFNSNDMRPGARPTPHTAPGRTMEEMHHAAPQHEAVPHENFQRHGGAPRPGETHPAETHPAPHYQAPRPQSRPEAARPRPEAARPYSETARPHPEAARPHPEAARPRPEAARPHPEAARPRPEAARPHPEAARPHPAPHPAGHEERKHEE